MRDYGLLRLRALELLREGWRSPSDLARELRISPSDAAAIIHELESRGLVFRDGPMTIAREGVRA